MSNKSKNRTINDFEGNPVLASCENCTWCTDDSDGPEYGGSCFICAKKGREHMSNLIGFPFKTGQECCELAIWFSVDFSKKV